jgi:hypothetical protein
MEDKITNEEVEKYISDITNKFFRSYKEERAQIKWEKEVRKRITDATKENPIQSQAETTE